MLMTIKIEKKSVQDYDYRFLFLSFLSYVLILSRAFVREYEKVLVAKFHIRLNYYYSAAQQ